jgi:hypothetical protein
VQCLAARLKKIRPAREDANESTPVFFSITLPDRCNFKGLWRSELVQFRIELLAILNAARGHHLYRFLRVVESKSWS